MVNKIAAGEIIIAPANALKEMLENSIDAGSSAIQVLVKEGGLKLLQITDNGSGIMKDDLPILCQRFTTSKLASFEDLNSIATYGFRGEALASISHVAHLSVTTKTKDSACAWRCQYSLGELVPQKPNESAEPKPVAGKTGTQITVENLFYNFTSRLRSLKSPNEEFLKILDVVNKYAIHTANVGFSVKKIGDSHNSMIIRESQSTKERIRMVYGSSVANNLVEVNLSEGFLDYGLILAKGQVTNMNYSSNKKTAQIIFFINNRLVNCDPLKKTLMNVFSVYLPKGYKPFIYMSLQIKPSQLDVNIHPTKKEVRFLNEDEIVEFICSGVQAELSKLDDLRTFRTQIALPKKNYLEVLQLPQSSQSSQPTKKQKTALTHNQLQSFRYGSSPSSSQPSFSKGPAKIQDSKLVRVDASQQKITSFLSSNGSSQSQKPVRSTENNIDSESFHEDDKENDELEKEEEEEREYESTNDQSFAEHSEFEVAPSSNADISSVSKNNFTFVANERVSVKIDTILELRSEVERGINKELTEVFSSFVFVGVVQYANRMLTFQHDIGLFLVDYGKLFYNLFYQIGLSDFKNFGKIFLKEDVSIRETVRFVLIQTTDNSMEENEQFIDEAIVDVVRLKDMLEEYFGMTIDTSDPSDPKLISLPLLLKNYIPPMDKLAIFLYKVLLKIDFKSERACLNGMLKEIALFYVPEPKPEFDKLHNGEETEEVEEYNRSIELLLSVVKRRLLATEDMINSIIEVANLPSLYKCFERC